MLRALPLAVMLVLAAPARAEHWPPLEKYVASCVLIVKAQTVKDGARWTFRVLESWRGTYDPTLFESTTKDGRFFAGQGEHGVDVVNGQEIVFFFTRSNQSHPTKLTRHSTSFPIVKGKLVYAKTSDFLSKEYSVADFKQAIQRVK